MSKELAQNKSMSKAGKDLYADQGDELIKSRHGKAEDIETKRLEAIQKEKTLWSEDQQKALEEALRTYPKSIPAKQRWTKISAVVEGKSPKDCLERFKYIVTLMKKKKTSK